LEGRGPVLKKTLLMTLLSEKDPKGLVRGEPRPPKYPRKQNTLREREERESGGLP